MLDPKKGILAADESTPTITKRFDSIKLESTEENRRRWRELLFTTEGLEEYISGVILYDETLRQTKDNLPFPSLLWQKGIVAGIKVDTGAKSFGPATGKVTQGLDGLNERLQEYKVLGAKFAKWRAVLDTNSSTRVIEANADNLAQYAFLCQQNGIVPIVEPEVLMDGSHSIERSSELTEKVLWTVFNKLYRYGVELESMILKPNMVLSGYASLQFGRQLASVTEVAEETVLCLRRTVPAAVPGIAFLSGGQLDTAAINHLRVINSLWTNPWRMTFSFGRALQREALKTWKGRDDLKFTAQLKVLEKAQASSLASQGL